MLSTTAILSKFAMLSLRECPRQHGVNLAKLRLLKMAGFQAPISGWFSAPADTLAPIPGLWGSAPGGPGGGMGMEVGPTGAGGKLAPPGIGAREAYFGGCIVFRAAIGGG